MFSINALLLFLDWNSWLFDSVFRYAVGIPFVVVGAALVSWGVVALGAQNTYGLPGGFVETGPYRFTRNPQYLGDILLFLGLSVVANSLYLWISHAMLIVLFVIAPIAEESWLEEQYGEPYIRYKLSRRRFL